jgi:lipoate-protein ligase A
VPLQDLGNTNYSFHIARESFTRQQHAKLVAHALNRRPIALKESLDTDLGDGSLGAYVNKRNDICISLKDRKGPERKVSGSAYKIISTRAYHHGTMLLSSNLSNLGSALKPSRTAMHSKGVESVPSPVSNLADAFASRKNELTHDLFCQAVVDEFQRTYGEAEIHKVGQENYTKVLEDAKHDLHAGWTEMDSWEWTWGQTPEFSHRIRSEGLGEVVSAFEIDLHVRHGIIQSAEVRCDSAMEDGDLVQVVQRLQGKRYNVFGDAPSVYGDSKGADGLKELDYEPQGQDRQVQIARLLLQWLKLVL